MPTKRHVDAVDGLPLMPRDLELLLYGPWTLGLNLHAREAQFDRLFALWAAHEEAVRREGKRRGLRRPWFVDRMLLVEALRGRP